MYNNGKLSSSGWYHAICCYFYEVRELVKRVDHVSVVVGCKMPCTVSFSSFQMRVLVADMAII